MLNLIVLPQPQFRINKDYKTVEKIIREEEDTSVDYELVDYHFDEVIDVFDGGAIATPSVFMQIRSYRILQKIKRAVSIKGHVE